MMNYVIGLDGGGTKTVSVLVSTDGRIVDQSVGESSNFQVIGGDKLQSAIRNLVEKQLATARVSSGQVRCLYAGLAGAGRVSDREKIYALLQQLGLAEQVVIDTDAAAALAGAFMGDPGIILIAGTGAICFGKTRSGEMIRSGGWGYMLGDEGSGFFIGQQAIMAALKDLDGRGTATALRPMIERRYSLNRIDEIIPRVYSGELDRTEIASIGVQVFELAADGDAVAQQVIALAASEQGKMVAAVAEKMAMRGKSIDVALIGSVFKQKQVLESGLRKEAEAVAARVNLIEPMVEPAVGSAILALSKIGIAITAEIKENFKKSHKT